MPNMAWLLNTTRRVVAKLFGPLQVFIGLCCVAEGAVGQSAVV